MKNLNLIRKLEKLPMASNWNKITEILKNLKLLKLKLK